MWSLHVNFPVTMLSLHANFPESSLWSRFLQVCWISTWTFHPRSYFVRRWCSMYYQLVFSVHVSSTVCGVRFILQPDLINALLAMWLLWFVWFRWFGWLKSVLWFLRFPVLSQESGAPRKFTIIILGQRLLLSTNCLLFWWVKWPLLDVFPAFRLRITTLINPFRDDDFQSGWFCCEFCTGLDVECRWGISHAKCLGVRNIYFYISVHIDIYI